MTSPNSKTPDPVKVFDDAVEELDRLHQQLASGTQQLGGTLQILTALRPAWIQITNSSSQSTTTNSLVSSNATIFEAYGQEVKQLREKIAPSLTQLHYITSVDSFVAATGATQSFIHNAPGVQDTIGLVSQDKRAEYKERFDRLDHSLGRTYEAIWETLLTTRADPERAALFMIRQTFDHLFSILAPDDELRKIFAEADLDPDDEKIQRKDRILYAIRTRISDAPRANTLATQVQHMIRVYGALNRAHHRGELDKQKALKAVAEMESFLRAFIDAMDV